MIRSLALALVVAVAGCNDTFDTTDVPLDQWDAKLALHRNGLELDLDIVAADCQRLPDAVYATLDGELGVLDHGGHVVDTCDIESCDETCTKPMVSWNNPTLGSGAATFILTDDVTTWTYQVDHLAAERTFTIQSPTATVHGGDLVTVHMTPAIGRVAKARAIAVGAFVIEDANLVRVGSDVQFTAPPIAAATTTTLDLNVSVDVPTVACDAPGGCSASDVSTPSLPITLAP